MILHLYIRCLAAKESQSFHQPLQFMDLKAAVDNVVRSYIPGAFPHSHSEARTAGQVSDTQKVSPEQMLCIK
jgi:hypothetical protein